MIYGDDQTLDETSLSLVRRQINSPLAPSGISGEMAVASVHGSTVSLLELR